MAEANLEQEPEVCELFEKAANHLQLLVKSVDQETLLQLYGLYKQASVGICNTPQPGWFQMQARKKWDAWKELGDMNRLTAMNNYIQLIAKLDPEWDSSSSSEKQSTGWVAVSSLPDTDTVLGEGEKDIFDYVKEGNINKVTAIIRESDDKHGLGRLYDADGMGLIHWAADRGNVQMLRALKTELDADLELTDGDGQTALHYAAACGHTDVVQFLLESGADPNASDGGGLMPSDIASESNIEDLLVRKK